MEGRMRFDLRIIALAASLLAMPTLVQTTEQNTGKGALLGACSAEAQKFWANTPQGEGQLRSSLQEHRAELTESCKTAVGGQPKG
jgi:hypothetical protein